MLGEAGATMQIRPNSRTANKNDGADAKDARLIVNPLAVVVGSNGLGNKGMEPTAEKRGGSANR